MAFHYINPTPHVAAPPDPLPASFTLTAAPGTDVWRKPPNLDSFNAPILYCKLPLSSFRRARVTLSGLWRTLYDQGGLCLVLPQIEEFRKWVKTGIEFTHGAPHISTVACDRWADWGLLPSDGDDLTVEMEREVVDGKETSTLWVNVVMNGGQRRPVREITWVFEEAEEGKDNNGGDERECWVGVYTAKPTRDTDDEARLLQVQFRDLVIETTEDGKV